MRHAAFAFSTGTWTYGFSPLVASADCGATSLAVALCPGAPCYDDPTAAGPLNVTCLCPVGREEEVVEVEEVEVVVEVKVAVEEEVVVVVVPCGVCGPPPLRAALLRAPPAPSVSRPAKAIAAAAAAVAVGRSSAPARPKPSRDHPPPHAPLARRHVVAFRWSRDRCSRDTKIGFRSTPSARRPARRST